ncbi:hypothetical protein [Aureibaculum conchae]|uniref:hypothetical protein n=1 Tax=Aureibaculum sp. 2308TA14-22 TaxID=3108392 RepID=UPI00339702DA
MTLNPVWKDQLDFMPKKLDDWMVNINDKGLLENLKEIFYAFEEYKNATFLRNEETINKLSVEVMNLNEDNKLTK